ncbi:Flagellar brake protein [Gammaproteobacteria bacterium]
MPEENTTILEDTPPETIDEKSPLDSEADSGLKFQVGDTVQLELLSDLGQSQQRYLVKVIGYVPNQSILVTTPSVKNKVVLIRVGQLMNVRLMAARRLIGFRSNVLRTQFRPYPYLHLSYPEKFSSVKIRRSQRAMVHIIAGIKNEKMPEKDNIPALILDISVGGALIESSQPLGVTGDKILIAVRLLVAELERYLSLVAVIRSIQATEGSSKSTTNMYHHGVEFITAPSESGLVLHGFVHEQIVNSLTGMD